MTKKIYLIGSLRNKSVPEVASQLRVSLPQWEIFDDWYAAGPEADDYWKSYEQERGHSYSEAMAGYAAQHVFEFDKHHLDAASAGLLLLPAGKSGHLELGYLLGRGVPGYILLDPDDVRWDVMYLFANKVTSNIEEIIDDLRKSGEVH